MNCSASATLCTRSWQRMAAVIGVRERVAEGA
jgi:hypothetical protein